MVEITNKLIRKKGYFEEKNYCFIHISLLDIYCSLRFIKYGTSTIDI